MESDTFLILWLISMPITAIGFMVYYNLFEHKVKEKDGYLILAFICTLLFPMVVIAGVCALIIYGVSQLLTKLIRFVFKSTNK